MTTNNFKMKKSPFGMKNVQEGSVWMTYLLHFKQYCQDLQVVLEKSRQTLHLQKTAREKVLQVVEIILQIVFVKIFKNF